MRRGGRKLAGKARGCESGQGEAARDDARETGRSIETAATDGAKGWTTGSVSAGWSAGCFAQQGGCECPGMGMEAGMP